ncbi:glycosyltransferase family 2 protein [Zongyangia hominis]|uniref:glycosyltransferase family 2 protein n=1 Tax=Zongyangia hominis TaxID=2763677 RepID=UPI0037095ACC
MLSLVVPAFNEQENVAAAAAAVKERMKAAGIAYELIFVDDGSSDGTWGCIQEEADKDPAVRGLRFSRNFGKEGAIFAGLRAAKGDCVAVMDCDLQHPPETVVEMYRIWEKNDVDVVEARKSSRGKENFLYKGFSKLFYGLLKAVGKIDLENCSDFKLMSREVVDALNAMPERQTFFRALSSWVGYRTAIVYFEVPPRNAGTSKWSVGQLFRYAMRSISSFSTAPMQAVTICGFLFFIFAVILGVQTLVSKLIGHAEAGFPTVILLLLLIGSIIMFSLGVIGYYIARIYDEVKFRPRYIIQETTDGKGQKDITKD